MPIFTENPKLNFLIFQTAYFILNFQNLLEPGLKKTLPELLPVPWLWVGTRNVSNARVNPELRLSCHTKVILFHVKLTLYVSSVTSLSVWLQQLKHSFLPQVKVLDTENWKYGVLQLSSNIIPIGIAHPADWEDSGFLHVSALKASKFTPSSSSFTRLERI